MPADQYIIEAANAIECEWPADYIRVAAKGWHGASEYPFARAILFAAEVLEREAAKAAEIARLLYACRATITALSDPLERAAKELVGHGKVLDANAEATLDMASNCIAAIDNYRPALGERQ